MKYLGEIALVEEFIAEKNLTVQKVGESLVGTNTATPSLFIFVPIYSDVKGIMVHGCFEVQKNCDVCSLISALSPFIEDVKQSFIPITDNQRLSLLSIISNNMPHGAFYEADCKVIDSTEVSLRKSGRNYSIMAGNNTICDLGEKSAAISAFNIIKTAMSRLINSIALLINKPE